MRVFGKVKPYLMDEINTVLFSQKSTLVTRKAPARSSVPHPQSTDLEFVLAPKLETHSFQHHIRIKHPLTGKGFEYDFWRERDGVAIEVMGYRADDEIYKNILKFHVHKKTKIGVVFVPRYKWMAARKTDINYVAVVKALEFANTFLNLNALIAVPYDWEKTKTPGKWKLIKPK